MADPHSFRVIFDHLPDVYFFVKDRQSRIIAVSSSILERFGPKSEWDFIGTTDEQFFPPDVAADYVAADRQVFKTRQPIIDRLEIWFDENRKLDGCLTTKAPLRGRDGSIIGLMGVTRREQALTGRPLAREGIGRLRLRRPA
jgi:PAS domain-containing protein